jgi:uncharacterized membrane protein
MKTRFIAVCIVLIALVSAVTWHYFPALPERIPVHWNAAGEVDGHGPRAMLWLLGPGLMTLVALLGLALPRLSPRRYDVTAFESTWLYSTGVVVVLLAYVHMLVLIVATGGQVPMDRAVPAGMCIVLILVSNPLGLVGVLAGAPGWLVLLLMFWWAPVAVLYSLACYKRLEKAGTLESS